MVRCSACRHTWFQPPPRPEPQDAPPVPPDFRAMEAEAPRRRQRMPERRESRGGGGGIAIIAILIVVVLLIAIGAAAFIMRDRIVAEFPQAAPIYEAVGFAPRRAPIAGEGLAVRNEALSREEIGGRPALVLTGEVANLSQTVRPVPLLKAVLLDAAQSELAAVTFEVDAQEIAVGGSVPFTTRIENPPPEATNLSIVFVARPPATD